MINKTNQTPKDGPLSSSLAGQDTVEPKTSSGKKK